MAVDSPAKSEYFTSMGWTDPARWTQSAAEHAVGALSAFGGQVVARPSPIAGYLVQDLEVDLEWSIQVCSRRVTGPRLLDIKVAGGSVVVYLQGAEEDLGRATECVFRGDLRELVSEYPTPPEPRVIEPLPADAGVEQIATRISRLSGFSDRDLSRLFPGQVHRETYQRWRTGVLDNPTPANRRRMGLLVRLIEDLAVREVSIGDWLMNPTSLGLTPYELLVEGRLDEAEALAAEVGRPPESYEAISDEGLPVLVETARPSFIPHSAEPAEDLTFDEDDEGWQEIGLDLDEDNGE